ncbi:MAG: hypothetical protein IT379_23605 [Deltaproteobacteria bacterium]|nr:hypothetical protein [Deltaproteobacteria bacterium]
MDGAGSANTLALADRFRDGFFGDQPPSQASRDAHENKRYWARISQMGRYAAPEHVSRQIYEITVELEVTYFVENPAEADKWRAVIAAAAYDAHRVRLALCTPGNLTATAAAVSTQLADGCLEFVRWSQEPPRAAERVILTASFEFTAIFLATVPA